MKLNIPNPCSQKWEEMLPQGQHRFCNACNKSIIDFTSLSDAEVIAHFKNRSGNVCGRMNESQLNRTLVSNYKTPFRFSRPFVVLLGLFSAAGAAVSQTNVLRDENGIEIVSAGKHEHEINCGSVTIKGKVTDAETGEPLPFVNVIADSLQLSAVTDFDGFYSIRLKQPAEKQIKLTFQYLGYEVESVIAAVGENEDCIINQKVIMKSNFVTMGLIFEPVQKRSFWKRVFGRKRK